MSFPEKSPCPLEINFSAPGFSLALHVLLWSPDPFDFFFKRRLYSKQIFSTFDDSPVTPSDDGLSLRTFRHASCTWFAHPTNHPSYSYLPGLIFCLLSGPFFFSVKPPPKIVPPISPDTLFLFAFPQTFGSLFCSFFTLLPFFCSSSTNRTSMVFSLSDFLRIPPPLAWVVPSSESSSPSPGSPSPGSFSLSIFSPPLCFC